MRAPSLLIVGQPSPLNDSHNSLDVSCAGGNSSGAIAGPSGSERKTSTSTDDVLGISYNFHICIMLYLSSILISICFTYQQLSSAQVRNNCLKKAQGDKLSVAYRNNTMEIDPVVAGWVGKRIARLVRKEDHVDFCYELETMLHTKVKSCERYREKDSFNPFDDFSFFVTPA